MEEHKVLQGSIKDIISWYKEVVIKHKNNKVLEICSSSKTMDRTQQWIDTKFQEWECLLIKNILTIKPFNKNEPKLTVVSLNSTINH
jgi:hypothetical protein